MNRGHKLWVDAKPFRDGWQLTMRYRGVLLVSKSFKTELEARDWGDLAAERFKMSAIPSHINYLKESISKILDPIHMELF